MNHIARAELKAKPHCCEEASPMSHAFYIPCDKPAAFMVKNRDPIPYRMCEACADHNVRNRGAKVIGPYEAAPTIEPTDQFAAWREALATGKPVAYERGQPTAGYYKVRDRNQDRSIRWDAVAIWRDEETDEWVCMRTGPRRAPTHADEIEELCASCTSTPISFDLFTSISEGGAWPEQIAPVEIPDNLPPHEAEAAKLRAQQDAARAWLLAIGGRVTTKDEADKAANFAGEFTKIETKAKKLHAAEKAPFIEGGKAVDAKWFPTRDAAAEAKTWAKRLSDDFAVAETRRRQREADEENAKRLAEFEKAQAEERARLQTEERMRAVGAPVPEAAVPPPAVVPLRMVAAEPVRIGTTGRKQSLVKVKTYAIDDATALLHFLAERNAKSPALCDAALRDARLLAEAGVEVPGLLIGSKEEMR